MNSDLAKNHTEGTLRVVSFFLMLSVICITSFYLIRICSTKHERVMQDMQKESLLLESVITHHLNYARYFTTIVARHIKNNINEKISVKNKKNIARLLKRYFQISDSDMFLGLRKYSWTDDKFFETVNSSVGVLDQPQKINFINKIKKTIQNPDDPKNRTIFNITKNNKDSYRLEIVSSIIDKNTQKYFGSIILSYDIDTIVNYLKSSRKNKSTHFVLLDENFNHITQSETEINKIVNDKNEFSIPLKTKIQNFKSNSVQRQKLSEGYSYLDMVNGVNYFIKALDGSPFYMIVNINNQVIKDNILDSITKKFIELFIFSFIILVSVFSVYKRETFLRTKAERATKIAYTASKAKTDFLAFTAHEIRSPLGLILTGSEVMKRELLGTLPNTYMEYAEGIYKNANIILDFITDILDENQIEEGKFKIIKKVTHIENIIDKVIVNNKARYKNRNPNIITDIENNIPLLICDKRRILQVLNNLLSNAIKYSYINCIITIIAKIKHGRMIVQVIDNGIGMKAKDIEIALSVYGTIHKDTQLSIDSYGLGLPIVKMLVEAHNAKLSIDSIPAKGTTVTITFAKNDLLQKKKITI